MSCRLRQYGSFALVGLTVFLCLMQPWCGETRYRRTNRSVRMEPLPRWTLWSWDRSEDLRSIDPKTTAVAYLDQTISLGEETVSVPRHHSLVYPADTVQIAVVRIEVLAGARLDAPQSKKALELLLTSATRDGTAALQIDFDATRSERAFYRNLLLDLRRQMPAALPLSITALASWCSSDDWIGALPVDEAVPMLFRMEPDRGRASSTASRFTIHEPLCTGSVGISTREAWPENLAQKRVYVFSDDGWREDLALLAERKLQ